MLLKGKKQSIIWTYYNIFFTTVKSTVGVFWVSHQNILGLPWLRKLVDWAFTRIPLLQNSLTKGSVQTYWFWSTKTQRLGNMLSAHSFLPLLACPTSLHLSLHCLNKPKHFVASKLSKLRSEVGLPLQQPCEVGKAKKTPTGPRSPENYMAEWGFEPKPPWFKANILPTITH